MLLLEPVTLSLTLSDLELLECDGARRLTLGYVGLRWLEVELVGLEWVMMFHVKQRWDALY